MTIEEIKAMTKDFKEQYNNIRDQSKNAENILIELQKLNESLYTKEIKSVTAESLYTKEIKSVTAESLYTKEIKSVTAERKLGKRGNGNSV